MSPQHRLLIRLVAAIKADLKFQDKYDPVLYGSKHYYFNATFGGATDKELQMMWESDWDFAVQYNFFNEEALSENGWTKLEIHSYQDASTISVFEKDIEGQKVQVSFRANIVAFSHVINCINPDFYHRYIWKHSKTAMPKEMVRRYLDSMYHVYDCGVIAGPRKDLKIWQKPRYS